MSARGGRPREIIRAAAVALLAACLGCGSVDGGGRGTGLGAATISGNIATTGVDAGSTPMCPFAGQNAFVSVRGTGVQAPVEADCTFALDEVPPGDVILDFASDERSGTVRLNSVPPESVVVLTDVRLRDDTAEVAAIEVRPAGPSRPRSFAVIADPPTGDAPLEVQLSFGPTPIAGTTVTWVFGDHAGTSTELTPAHLYALPGDYIVALTVAEPGREAQAAYAVVRVTEPPPAEPLSVRLSAEPKSGPPPLGVEFQATVFGARPAAKLSWSFGDGTAPLVTEATTVMHVYLRSGSFTAVVTVTDDLGRQAGGSFPVVVERSAVTVRPTATLTPRPEETSARPSATSEPDGRATPTPSRGSDVVATPTPADEQKPTETPGSNTRATPTSVRGATVTATPAFDAVRTPTLDAGTRPTATVPIHAVQTPTAVRETTATRAPTAPATAAPTTVPTAVRTAAETRAPTATAARTAAATASVNVAPVATATVARPDPTSTLVPPSATARPPTPVASATRAFVLPPTPVPTRPPAVAPTRAPTAPLGRS